MMNVRCDQLSLSTPGAGRASSVPDAHRQSHVRRRESKIRFQFRLPPLQNLRRYAQSLASRGNVLTSTSSPTKAISLEWPPKSPALGMKLKTRKMILTYKEAFQRTDAESL